MPKNVKSDLGEFADEIALTLDEKRAKEHSNLATIREGLVSALHQYHEGAITYGEFINWILQNIPAPTDEPVADTVYRCLYAGAYTAMELERAELERQRTAGDIHP